MPYTLSEKGESLTIEAHGKKLTQAFADGARGLFHALVNTDAVGGDERVEFAVQASSLKDLYHAWLSELVGRATENGMVFCDFTVLSIQKVSAQQYLLMGSAHGEAHDDKKHGPVRSVKKINTAGLACSERDGAASCTVTVDFW
ncbi:MAG: archease [Patescibacteria group bacterium]